MHDLPAAMPLIWRMNLLLTVSVHQKRHHECEHMAPEIHSHLWPRHFPAHLFIGTAKETRLVEAIPLPLSNRLSAQSVVCALSWNAAIVCSGEYLLLLHVL